MSLVDLNYNFECDWLVELSDNKLSDNKVFDNKLSDNNLTRELVGNTSFFKPITIEEIVIFFIRIVTVDSFVFNCLNNGIKRFQKVNLFELNLRNVLNF